MRKFLHFQKDKQNSESPNQRIYSGVERTKSDFFFVFPLTVILSAFLLFPVFGSNEAFLHPSNSDYDARLYPIVFSLPLSFFAFLLFRNKHLHLRTWFCSGLIIASLSLTVFRIYSDFWFLKYRREFSESISRFQGFVLWDEVRNSVSFKVRERTEMQSWKMVSMSLMYPAKQKIQTVITGVSADCTERLDKEGNIHKNNLKNRLICERERFPFENFLRNRFFDLKKISPEYSP